MMSPADFAAKVRAKYPGAYDSLDDATLTQKVLAKYPEYSSSVDMPSQAPKQGQLESGALGLMSGIPGAEAAVSGIKAISPDKTYEQAHQELESAKDQAWDQNPAAYGTGKAAGMVGTGLVAPAGIPAAIGIGAASGLDTAQRPADMLADTAKGAAVGGVLGTIGERVISPLLEKLPGMGKAVLSSLGKETTPETIESYLANPSALNNASTKEELAEQLSKSVGKLGEDTGQMSAQAKNLLNSDVTPLETSMPNIPGRTITSSGTRQGLENLLDPSVGMRPEAGRFIGVEPEADIFPTPGKSVVHTGGRADVEKSINPAANLTSDTLEKLVDEIKAGYLHNGVPKSSAAESAINALDSQLERMSQIAEANGGKLSELDLKNQISELQKLSQRAFVDDATVSQSKDALKNLSGALNGVLKESNPAYGQAMEPVAQQTGMLERLKDKFALTTDTEGKVVPSDQTASRVMNAIKEGKTESYELLNELKEVTGVDYLQKVKDSVMANALNSPGAGEGLRNVMTGVGFGFGHMTHIPFGGVFGAAGGRMLANSLNGGQIAKSIMDKYLSFQGSGMNAALAKYGPMLINAAKAGGNQLASTHFVLATSNPDYQKLVEEHQDQAQ